MLEFRLPGEADREEVMAFYQEFEESGGTCIGFGGWRDYDRWLQGMKNRPMPGKTCRRAASGRILISAGKTALLRGFSV